MSLRAARGTLQVKEEDKEKKGKEITRFYLDRGNLI